jgi:hypothetical protein
MIHSDEELGELSSVIKELRIRFYGANVAEQDRQSIWELWKYTRTWVLEKVGDSRGLIIYQDGIPVGPREKIQQLFTFVLKEHPHSPLFLFTKELLDSGAVLEGTEDFNLLQKRVAAYKEIYRYSRNCRDLNDVREHITKKVEELDDLVLQSDQFIARRISQTLPEDGRGILFMGYRHRVDEELINMQRTGLLPLPIQIVKLGLQIEKKTHGKTVGFC